MPFRYQFEERQQDAAWRDGEQPPQVSNPTVANQRPADCVIFPVKWTGASAIKCCYAAAGSGTGSEETGLRALVSRKTSIRNHKGIVVAKKMSRKVSRRVVRPELRAVGRSCNSNGATPGAHRASPSSERGKAFVSKGMPSFAGWSDSTAR